MENTATTAGILQSPPQSCSLSGRGMQQHDDVNIGRSACRQIISVVRNGQNVPSSEKWERKIKNGFNGKSYASCSWCSNTTRNDSGFKSESYADSSSNVSSHEPGGYLCIANGQSTWTSTATAYPANCNNGFIPSNNGIFYKHAHTIHSPNPPILETPPILQCPPSFQKPPIFPHPLQFKRQDFNATSIAHKPLPLQSMRGVHTQIPLQLQPNAINRKNFSQSFKDLRPNVSNTRGPLLSHPRNYDISCHPSYPRPYHSLDMYKRPFNPYVMNSSAPAQVAAHGLLENPHLPTQPTPGPKTKLPRANANRPPKFNLKISPPTYLNSKNLNFAHKPIMDGKAKETYTKGTKDIENLNKSIENADNIYGSNATQEFYCHKHILKDDEREECRNSLNREQDVAKVWNLNLTKGATAAADVQSEKAKNFLLTEINNSAPFSTDSKIADSACSAALFLPSDLLEDENSPPFCGNPHNDIRLKIQQFCTPHLDLCIELSILMSMYKCEESANSSFSASSHEEAEQSSETLLAISKLEELTILATEELIYYINFFRLIEMIIKKLQQFDVWRNRTQHILRCLKEKIASILNGNRSIAVQASPSSNRSGEAIIESTAAPGVEYRSIQLQFEGSSLRISQKIDYFEIALLELMSRMRTLGGQHERLYEETCMILESVSAGLSDLHTAVSSKLSGLSIGEPPKFSNETLLQKVWKDPFAEKTDCKECLIADNSFVLELEELEKEIFGQDGERVSREKLDSSNKSGSSNLSDFNVESTVESLKYETHGNENSERSSVSSNL